MPTKYENTNIVKEAIKQAESLSGSSQVAKIEEGMGYLRRVLEVTVLDKLLNKVTKRWSDQIRVLAIEEIVWDKDVANDICRAYEEISRFINAHSQSEESIGRPPNLTDLKEACIKVEKLIGEMKKGRKQVVQS